MPTNETKLWVLVTWQVYQFVSNDGKLQGQFCHYNQLCFFLCLVWRIQTNVEIALPEN